MPSGRSSSHQDSKEKVNSIIGMGKVIYSILLSVFALSLSACGNGDEISDNKDNFVDSGQGRTDTLSTGHTGTALKTETWQLDCHGTVYTYMPEDIKDGEELQDAWLRRYSV